jgi:hypothetical protein
VRFINHPIFRWATEPWFGFHAPSYEPNLISELKAVPVKAWDPAEKTWWYPAFHFPVVEATCASYFINEMQGGRYLNFLATAPTNDKLRDRVRQLEQEVASLRSQLHHQTPF